MLAPVDLSKKYSSFLAPKNQILLNQENLQQKYGANAVALTVELPSDLTPKFSFTVDDPQAKWVNTTLFDPQKTVEIQLGYGAIIETIFSGEITTSQITFSSSCSPKISVSGEGKTRPHTNSNQVYLLEYGKTLLNFTATMTVENKTAPLTTIRSLTPVSSLSNLRCVAECIGLPEIKPGAVISLTGLAGRFNLNYVVEKVVHSWDGTYGFRTSFEAKALPRTAGIFRPNI